jgi:probable rRNA maturation factor
MAAKILIFVESRYRVSRKRIKATIDKTLSENKVVSPVEVSLAIVGDRKMKSLNKKYRGLDKTTNVLSFPIGEGEVPALPPSNVIRLGDIVLSFPQVIRDAARDEMMVDEKVDELISHGLTHLLGIHHE